MNQGECVQDFVTKVLDIVYKIRMMKEDLPQKSMVSKILRSLTPRFSLVVHSIIEAQDLNTLTVERLSSSLKNHESILNIESSHHEGEKAFMLGEVQHNSVIILTEVEEEEVTIFPRKGDADVAWKKHRARSCGTISLSGHQQAIQGNIMFCIQKI